MKSPDFDPRTLLPHGPEMHYIRRLVECDEENCACVSRLDADNPFAVDGKVPSFVAVEAIAQTSAVHEAGRRWSADEPFSPKVGFLVSAADLQFSAAMIPVDQDFETRIIRLMRVGPLAEYRVEARLNETVFVSGTMKTFATE